MGTLPFTVHSTPAGKQVENAPEHFVSMPRAVKFAVAQTKLGHQNVRIENRGQLDTIAMQAMQHELAKAAQKKSRPEVRALEHLSELSAVFAKIVKTEDLTGEQREELTQAYLAVARALPTLDSWASEAEIETQEGISKVPSGSMHSTIVGKSNY